MNRTCILKWHNLWYNPSKQSHLLLLVIFLQVVLLASVPQKVFSQHLIHRTVTTADGLPSDYINHISQDKDGYIWISTDKGVCRFDGSTVTKFTVDNGLPNNFITSAYQDKKGGMWFGSFGQPALTNFHQNKAINHTTLSKGIHEIFFDSSNRTFYIDNFAFTCLQQPLPITKKIGTATQILPISKNIFLVNSPGKITWVDVRDAEPKIMATQLDAVLGGSRMYLHGNHIYFLKNEMAVKVNYTKPYPWQYEVIYKNNFTHLCATLTDSSIILGSYKGLKTFSFSTQTITSINPLFDLPEIGINYFFRDRNDNLWIGTHGKGIIICPKNPVAITEYESDRIISIAEGEGTIAVATVSGLFWWQPHSLTSLGKNKVYQQSGLYFFNGNWWLSDYQFLYGPSKELKDIYNRPSVNISNGISSFLIDKLSGMEFIGSYADGIIRRKDGKIWDTLHDKKGLCSNTIENLVATPMGVAALSYSNGFNLIQPAAIQHFDKSNGLYSNTVYTVSYQNDSLWIGTDGGMQVMVNGKILPPVMLNPRTVGNRIRLFFKDRLGRNFVVTNKSLCLREGLYLRPIGSQKILSRDREIITASFFDEEKDLLLLGTSRGVANLYMNRVVTDTLMPALYLEKITTSNKDVTQTKSITFSGPENDIIFQFNAQTFLKGLSPTIVVKLRGYDTAFLALDNPYTLTYKNLAPGNYVLEAYIINGDGLSSEIKSLYTISVNPFWWQTRGFIILAVLLAGGLSAWWVYNTQQKRFATKMAIIKLKEEQQIQRDRIRRELHDNIGSQLSYVIAQMDWMEQNANRYSVKKIEDSLKELGENTRQVVNELRESMWSLKHDMITLEMLEIRLQQVIQKCKSQPHVPQILFTNEVTAHASLAPHVALNLLRIFQEGLHNVIKHGNAKHVHIQLSMYNEALLLLKIKDDGIGFDNTAIKNPESYGLENMERRAHESGINLTITSSKGLGVQIKAIIPLEE